MAFQNGKQYLVGPCRLPSQTIDVQRRFFSRIIDNIKETSIFIKLELFIEGKLDRREVVTQSWRIPTVDPLPRFSRLPT